MPVGVTPFTPVTVAVSVFGLPRTIDPEPGVVTIDGGALVTLKHSRMVDPSVPPA